MWKMSDTAEPASSGECSSSLRCHLCKKSFAQESTRKRHYYYCRSRISDPSIPRRRSCISCVRAKTRCTWTADTSLDTCNRCSKRGIDCQFDATVKSCHLGSTSGADLDDSPGGETRETGTSSALTATCGVSSGVQSSIATQTCDDVIFPFGPSSGANWDVDFGCIDSLDFSNQLLPDQDVSYMTPPLNEVPALTIADTSSFNPWTLQLTSTSHFSPRTFRSPGHLPLAAVGMRILRSYPYMVLQRAAPPPFLSPLLYQWAESGKGPPLQALINCVSLVQMFKSRTEANTSFVWRLIKLEQERILAEYTQFDKWELLASLQALLFYCLLRLHETSVGQDAFDISLLTTVNLISEVVLCSRGEQCECELIDPGMAWRDWIYNESRRRVILMFQIINRFVDISSVSSYTSYLELCGFVLLPLPCITKLWNTQDLEGWKTAFRLCYEERAIYGLSESGAVTRLQKVGDAVEASVVRWEEWCAEVSDLGPLVMIVGSLV